MTAKEKKEIEKMIEELRESVNNSEALIVELQKALKNE